MPLHDDPVIPQRVTDVERERLRVLTFQAVAECIGKLAALRDSGHQFGRHNYPIRDVKATGTYGKVEWSSSTNAPASYRSAIGPSSNYRTAIPYSELEGIQALLTFVNGNPALCSWLTASDSEDDDLNDRLLTMQIADLPLEIVERHLHLAGWELDVGVLASIYAELEAWWLSEQLEVDLCIPILGIGFDCDDLVLDDAVRLIRLNDKEQLARWPGQYLGDQADYVAMATHALVVSGWTIRNHTALQWFRPPSPPEFIDAAERFLEALSIVTPHPSGYVQAVLKPVGWSPGYVADLPVLIAGPLVPDRKAVCLKPTVEPSEILSAEAIRTLSTNYRALTGKTEVQLAASRLLSAERRADAADRIVDLCVGLEALLSDSQGETTYKIALRAAAMLAEHGTPNPSAFLAPMKTVYAYRSSVVHGRASAKHASVQVGDEVRSTEDLAQLVLRLLLETRMHDPSLTPAEIDKRILGEALDLYSRKSEAN